MTVLYDAILQHSPYNLKTLYQDSYTSQSHQRVSAELNLAKLSTLCSSLASAYSNISDNCSARNAVASQIICWLNYLEKRKSNTVFSFFNIQ